MRCEVGVTAISDLNFAVIVEPQPINGHSVEQGEAILPETPDFHPTGTCFGGLPT